MILRGGVFNGFGAFDASSLMIALDPKAGAGVPFTSLLQGVLQQRGASKLVADGKWGQCSHSAFSKVFGVDPSPDALNQVFALDKFGVPTQNVSVWKPGVTDVCWNGTDKYEAPPVEQQLSNPDPAFLLANMFGLPIPAGFCTGGRVPDAAKKQCACPAGMYEDVNTGNCASFESPAKMDPNTTQTKLGTQSLQIVKPIALPTLAKATTTTADPKLRTASSYSAPSSTTTTAVSPSSSMTRLSLPGLQRTAGLKPATPATPAGMGTGTILVLGLLALGVAGGGYMLLRKKTPSQAVANRRRRRHHRRHCRRNCGE